MSSEMVYDVCVVGAGMFGSAAARYASSDPNVKVCLIGPDEPTDEDMNEREIFGAHYDEGRIVRNLDDHPARIVLARNSIRRFREIEQLSGVNFYEPVGCLFIGQKGSEFLEEVRKAARKTDTSLIEITGNEELQERYPFLKIRDDESALLDIDGAGYISPRRLVSLQKKVAKIQGCVSINSVAEEIRTATDGIQEIRTASKDTVKCKHVLLATGAFTNFKPQIPEIKPFALKYGKGTAVLVSVPEEEAKRLRVMPAIIRHREDLGTYMLPPIKYPDGNYYLKYGKSGEEDPVDNLEEIAEWYKIGGNKDIIDTHHAFATELLPGIKITGKKTIGCVLCYTPTGLPYIDRVSDSLSVAIAGNGRGAKFSNEVGRIAASLSTKGQWDSELEKDQFKALFK